MRLRWVAVVVSVTAAVCLAAPRFLPPKASIVVPRASLATPGRAVPPSMLGTPGEAGPGTQAPSPGMPDDQNEGLASSPVATPERSAAQQALDALQRDVDAEPEEGAQPTGGEESAAATGVRFASGEDQRAALEARKAFYAWSNCWNWWQLAGAVLIVVFALGIAAVGAGFAYVQLKRGPESSTELKISGAGVEVSTRVIGIIVLILAYLFFQTAARYAFTIEAGIRQMTP